ncbi:Cas4 protein of RAM cell wall integrity signaling network [Candida orthopsilosis Co 90-125]|uniref:Cas4 protein of RAM cell wall integrity signaling network n=1 Tax=Candida orthopsilosis (strain 90-125) TaxID=1136231 RepID=H8X6E6_CANO9|nr:Cas4 protein of RAM cell wall integrity signaling network [Candida orthopsilosis Co 90-125]CCG23557.1 Cas4 protein of RAM cell wall integrity signaling network [Candida orthopsilosis Co 90-125]
MIEIPDLDSIYIPKLEQDGTTDQETEQMNNAYARSIASSNSLTGNNARSIDQEPDMQEINSSLDGFEIDSLNFKNHSGLSFGSDQNISSQHVDYGHSETPTLATGLSILPNNLNEHKTTFKLQEPPVNGHYQIDSADLHSFEASDQVGPIETPKFALKSKNTQLSLNQSLASPMSIMPQHDHTEPSPQLPAPLSSASLQNVLTMNENGGLSRKNLATDFKTPAEYTLHIIFTQFVRYAERKLNVFLDYSMTDETSLFNIFAEGADPQFDKIVESLGYIARRKPKPVIDSVMFWRKSKSEVASHAAQEVEKVLVHARKALPEENIVVPPPKPKRSLSLMRSKSKTHRRNQSSVSTLSSDPEWMKKKQVVDSQVDVIKQTAINAEKKSLVSIYILCRVLMEVVKQTPTEVMGEDLGDKLEEIVYSQLKTTDPASTSQSIIRAANWTLFAQLLGLMSEKRFLSVSDRFVFDLEKLPQKINHEDEARLYLLISGMKYLKLNHYPPELFEDSKEFIQILAKFFDRTTNEAVLYAYCDSISNLVLPLANNLTAEANDPGWNEGIEKIYNKAIDMWRKLPESSTSTNMSNILNPQTSNFGSGWSHLMNVVTATLSVSRRELFSAKWYAIIEQNVFKLKPKIDVHEKTAFVVYISRLLWVYFNRVPDSLNSTIKKLDEFFKLILFNPVSLGKKQWLTPDHDLIGALAQMIQIIGYNHLNYTLENILLRLLREGFSQSLEHLQTEKLMLVVRSYIKVLKEFERKDKPAFPGIENEELGRSSPFQFVAKNSTNVAFHDEFSRSFGTLLKLLDHHYGITLVDSGSAKSSSSFGFFSNESLTKISKDAHLELFSDLIDAIPYTIVPIQGETQCASGVPLKQVVELLTRNAVHSSRKVSDASVRALKSLSMRKNPTTLLNVFAKFAFQLSEKTSSVYDSNYLNSPTFIYLLKLYTELLDTWFQSFEMETESVENPLAQDDELMNKDVLNDLYQINHKQDMPKSNTGNELEWKTIINSVESIEGNGLFFLCSQDPQVRSYGIKVLRIVDKFDQAIYNLTDREESELKPDPKSDPKHHSRSSSKFAADVGTRIIHILEGIEFHDIIKPFKKELSLPERQRLVRLKNDKNILIKVAESDYGIDSTMWFRIYPKILEILFVKCPMPVAMCRDIVCVSLVQMHELVLEFSENYKSNTSSLFSSKSSSTVPPEVLVNQWKLYLVFACITLTTTNEQKISFPTQPTHGRKRSLQMFIQHQKITSAKSIFRMVLPLLKSHQMMVREAVIVGLSHINVNIFKTFLENVPSVVQEWNTNVKQRNFADDRFRIEVIHILMNVTDKYKCNDEIYGDNSIVADLISIVKNVKSFLTLSTVQVDIDFQRLRRYFCEFLENVFLALQGDKLDLWLPFEARMSCFNYLKEWCGHGESSGITEERYNVITRKINERKDSPSAIALLEFERKRLEQSALSCMAILCSGKITQELDIPGAGVAFVSFDIPVLLNWIHALLEAEDKVQEIGKSALENLLQNNYNHVDVVMEVIKQCCTDSKSMPFYFCTYVDAFLSKDKSDVVSDELFVLVCFLCGNADIKVRQSAFKLLTELQKRIGGANLDQFVEAVYGDSFIGRRKVLGDIARVVSECDEERLYTRISYMAQFYNLVASRENIAIIMTTFLERVKLIDGDPSFAMILNNLLEISIKYEFESSEIEAMWIALCKGNFDIIFEYILNICLEHRNAFLVDKARQVIDYIAAAHPDKLYALRKLIGNLQPKMMIPPAAKPIEIPSTYPYVSDLSEVLDYSEKDAAFSLGQISVIFLVDLVEKCPILIEKLPLLLHISFTLLDHYLVLVREQAGKLLIRLIHTLAFNDFRAGEVISHIRNKDHIRSLWVYDDLNNDKKGARTPNNMISLVRNVLQVFSKIPTLQDDWSRIALTWGTTCAVRHSACRSFQIFRVLISFLDLSILKAMFHRLSNTISDESSDIQGFAMQILMTLNAIAAELDSQMLIDFPQHFWSSVACLSTIHEQEFIEVLSTMNKFISKIDLNATDTINCLISTFPPKWEGKFEGLQQIVTVGLRSSASWEPTLTFIGKLLSLKDSEIVGMGDSRVITALISNMPIFLNALETKTITPSIEKTATAIAQLAENKPSLAKILTSLGKNKFRSKKDFVVQIVTTMRHLYFPEYEVMILISLLKMLSNPTEFFRKELLVFLKAIISYIDFKKEEFIGLGADLISPLLRLLLTDFAEPALEVLDETDVISGSIMDRDILRMSLGNTTVKKEYENTATLFGIPEESGWSIPMPAVTAASTRNNVHAVFSTCVAATTVVDEQENNEEIQFHMEDYYSPSIHDNGDAVSVSVDETTLSNMWAALDDFDSFFNTDKMSKRKTISSPIEARPINRASPIESAPNTYDKKVSAILNKTLTTNSRNNLLDYIGENEQHASPAPSRRSYIPFRNRTMAKTRESLTPTIGADMSPHTPSSASLMTGKNSFNGSDVTQQAMSPDSTRLDGLLGKRSRKRMGQ